MSAPLWPLAEEIARANDPIGEAIRAASVASLRKRVVALGEKAARELGTGEAATHLSIAAAFEEAARDIEAMELPAP